MVSFILCHFAIKPELTKNKRGIGYALNFGHIAISKLNEPLTPQKIKIQKLHKTQATKIPASTDCTLME